MTRPRNPIELLSVQDFPRLFGSFRERILPGFARTLRRSYRNGIVVTNLRNGQLWQAFRLSTNRLPVDDAIGRINFVGE